MRERKNRYIIKGFRVPVQEWYFPVASCNNVFMLTVPENYGIVPVAEKIPATEKTGCSGQGNEGIQLQLNHCVSAFDA